MLTEADLAMRSRARIGTTILGKYRVDAVIGVGGMAVVYAARHRNGRRVALKILHPELSLHADLRGRFLREGLAANAVKHPGAVAVLDDDVAEDGSAFLVMELLDGESVETVWERHGRKLPVAAVVEIGVQLLDVLGGAHAGGIVHRDLKPPNLFLTREGVVKVLDFGIASVRDIATSEQITQTGIMLGTPAYMAPEQAMGKASAIDARTDLWAVGATLFTLLSGRFVHQAETPQAIVIDAATKPAPPLARYTNVPKLVAEVIDRALAFDRTARWPSAWEMRDALRVALPGGEPAAATLRALLANPDDTVIDRTVQDGGPVLPETMASEPDVVSTDEEPTLDETSAPARRPLPRLVGATTAKPVSSDSPTHPLRRPALGRRARLVAAMLAAGAGIAVAVGAWTVLGGMPTAPSPSASASPAAPPSLASAVPAPSLSSSTPEVTFFELPPAPTNSAAPAAAPSAVAPSPPPPTPARSTASPAAPKPNCTTPYDLDAQGHKHWKRECL